MRESTRTPLSYWAPIPIEQDGRTALAVRAYLPDTQQAWVLDPAHHVSRPMRRIHPAGLYEAICPMPQDPRERYMFRVADGDGEVTTMHDPYAFDSLLTDFDFYLFGQGRHERIYDKLGAHVRTVDGVTGTNFAVWAPNATSVSVVGDFNHWDARRHPMRKHIPSGIWELFVPDVRAGRAIQVPRSQLGRSDRSTRPIPTVSPPNCRRARRRSWPICRATTGTTRSGWNSGARATR